MGKVYYNQKHAILAIELEKKMLIKAIELIPQVIEVVKKFDNKVPSKRLETALKEINKGFRFNMEHNSFIIEIKFFDHDDRCTSDGDRAIYANEDSFRVCHMCISSAYGDQAIDNGRINANAVINSPNGLLAFLEVHKKTVQGIDDTIKNIEELKEQRKELLKQIEDFNSKVNYTFNNTFPLRIEVK